MEKNEEFPINIIIFENGLKPYDFLGKIMKDNRISRGYSLNDLMYILNVPSKALEDLESGYFDPSTLILLDRLACLYQIKFKITYEKLQ